MVGERASHMAWEALQHEVDRYILIQLSSPSTVGDAFLMGQGHGGFHGRHQPSQIPVGGARSDAIGGVGERDGNSTSN